MAASAFISSARWLQQRNDEFESLEIETLARGADLNSIAPAPDDLLIIANPHALHAPAIAAADNAGFQWIICEKPVAISKEQLSQLTQIKAQVFVCHGYRVQWGPRLIKSYIESGELGELYAIEGHYWQSSAAQRHINPNSPSKGWKDDTKLSGGADVLFDLVPHWLDLVCYLMGDAPAYINVNCYRNDPKSFRDSHVQVNCDFLGGKHSIGSVSKMAHGFGNELQVRALGSHALASWNFERPDEITVAKGHDQKVIKRTERTIGSGMPSFHSLGWLEGYVEILSQTLSAIKGRPYRSLPTLTESTKIMTRLFETMEKETL